MGVNLKKVNINLEFVTERLWKHWKWVLAKTLST